VKYLVAEHKVSLYRACQAAGMSRSGWYKTPRDRLEKDGAVIRALTTVTDCSGSAKVGHEQAFG